MRHIVFSLLLFACGHKNAAPVFGAGAKHDTVQVEQPTFSPPPPAVATRAPSSANSPPPVCSAVCRSPLPAPLLRALTARAKTARRCYEQALAGDSKLSVHMSVLLRLSPSGMPCEARVTKTDNENVSDCVVAVFRDTAFPPLEDEGCAEVNVPIVFVPSK
jgi:hypothetical protein